VLFIILTSDAVRKAKGGKRLQVCQKGIAATGTVQKKTQKNFIIK